MSMKNCTSCGTSFEVAQTDLDLLKKISEAAPELQSIPPPADCPDCRQQRRLARRNERTYHKRKCDMCKKDIVGMYDTDAAFPVYCYICWWSDQWDPLSYGQELDLGCSILDQFHALQGKVPRINLFGKNNENSDYINHSVDSKNCYLCVDVRARDTYYSKWIIDCSDCCDSYQLEKSELCYESQYSVNLHRSVYAFLCDKSSNLAFCYDCEDCHDCFLCSHLRHKRFCIGNEQLTETECRKRMQEWDFSSYKTLQETLKRYHDMWKQTFHRDQRILFSEDCSGDFIYHCKNVQHSFGVIESRDCLYCYDAGYMQDCMDAYEPAFHCELQYDSHGCNGGKRMLASHICYDNDSLAYCDFCHNCSNLFGCISLRRKKYCILNKQYSKEDYAALVPQVIEQMKKDGEWGRFFPVPLSPFCYNESTAQEYYPLTKQKAAEHGWQWRDQMDMPPDVQKIIPADQLPDRTKDIPDDVLNWALRCTVTDRPYRIQHAELALYRTMNLPLPRLHPDERHVRRMAFTNPRKLWPRTCAKCGKDIQTTFSPERLEAVYCEECYVNSVY